MAANALAAAGLVVGLVVGWEVLCATEKGKQPNPKAKIKHQPIRKYEGSVMTMETPKAAHNCISVNYHTRLPGTSDH